jgi:hypothetical protein
MDGGHAKGSSEERSKREVYSREERPSPLPAHWESMTRESAYRRYVHVFDWLIAGGSSEAATYWAEPELDLAFAAPVARDGSASGHSPS